MARRNYEKELLDRIKSDLAELLGVEIHRGRGSRNRLGIPGWDLAGHQQFQFGNLRIESPVCTLVVEVESAGGLTNLIKYWPYLRAAELKKRFVLVHVFRLASENDYVSHQKLWAFTVARMAEDLLAARGLRMGRDWDARLYQYSGTDYPQDALEFIRGACETRPSDGAS